MVPTISDPDSAAPKKFNFRIRNFASALSAAVPARAKRISLVVGAVSIALMGLLLVGAFVAEKMIEDKLDAQIAKALKSLPPNLHVSYSGVKLSLIRQSVRLLDVKIDANGKEIDIDRVRVWGIDWSSLMFIVQTKKPVVPREISIALDGVHVTRELLGGETAALLTSFGYGALTANLYSELGFDRQKNTFSLRDLQIDVPTVGLVSASLQIGNLSLPSSEAIARIKKDPKVILTETEAFTKMTLNGFSVTLTDDSLVKRISTSFVQNGELSPEQLAQLALETNMPSPRDPANTNQRAPTGNDFTQPALEKLRDFLHAPGKITLAMRPPQPIPLMSLLDDTAGGSINDLAHKLSLSVK